MIKRIPSRRPGFTLMELLIACALSGVVLALALRGFMDTNRVADLTRSKLESKSFASKGLQLAAQAIKQAHIFYYSGYPLATVPHAGPIPPGRRTNAAAIMGPGPIAGLQAALPAIFTGGGANPGPNPGETTYDPAAPRTSIGGLPRNIRNFRFASSMAAIGVTGATSGNGLMQVAPAAQIIGGTPRDFVYHNTFPSPLAYFAVADFANTVTAAGGATGGQNQSGVLPSRWTFYVIYLAPMSLRPGDANLSFPGDLKDRFISSTNPNAAQPWLRTMMPLQLRMMRIANVPAARNPNLANGIAGRVSWPPFKPLVDREVLDPPYDYSAANPANYDPVPIKSEVNATAKFDPGNAAGQRQYLLPGNPTPQFQSASGPRLNGPVTQYHPNFNNLGNEPPNDLALNMGPPIITDLVLANYIDPDAVAGTSVRFMNNMADPPPALGGTGPAVAGIGAYRPYIPAMGTECDYFANFGLDTMGATGAAPISDGASTLPSRALISVTTRYRTTRQVPFQFATSTMEVDLEGLSSYSSIRPRSR